MFERYSEKARRVIFFARYEASQLRSPSIETEHLLLGVIREAHVVLRSIKPDINFEAVQKMVVDRVPSRTDASIPPSADLPLSNESKRVLAYAAEEAERIHHHHIGAEHLLLGLLREKASAAAQLLSQNGFSLETTRSKVSQLPDPWQSQSDPRPQLVREPITIHGAPYDPQYVRATAAGGRRFYWEKKAFIAPDIVVKQDGAISFDRSLMESDSQCRLVEGGWNEVECTICGWRFLEGTDALRSSGYSNGRDWLCIECYERFIARDDSPPTIPA